MSEFAKKYLVVFICAVLACGILLVYWQVRNFDFVNYDDNHYVYENPHVSGGLSRDSVVWAFTAGHASNWHPLTWLSHMLDRQLFGPNPGWMHLVNVLFHIANTLLLFTVLKRMTGAIWPSAFVAAAFALHPMHVESVAWIAERKDVLSTFFMLLTLAVYVSYAKRGGKGRYFLAILLFALGLMAKPMLVTLPFVLLLVDYWPLGRLDTRQTLYRAIIEKIPFFALAAVSSAVTFLVQKSGGAVANINILPLHYRVANIFLSYAEYIGKMFRPLDMAVFYPFDAGAIQGRRVAVCVLLLLVITVSVIRFGRERKYLVAGWFWFLGTLVPVIGLVQVGGQAFADRYTYIPYIGLFIMIAWGVPELLSRWPHRKIAMGVSAAVALMALGICAQGQVSYWKDSLTLYSHAVEAAPNNYVAYYNRGIAYEKLGRMQEAIEDFGAGIRVKPDLYEANNSRGAAYSKLGRSTEAIEDFNRAIKLKPDYAEAYNNRGAAYNKLGRSAEAIGDFDRSISIKPDFADAYNNRGAAYYELGRRAEAMDDFNRAIKLKGDCAEAYSNRGAAYSALGRGAEAIEDLSRSIKLKPDYAEAYNNYGLACIDIGRTQDAMEAYKQAIKLKPDYAEAHYNLGNVYSGLGRYQEAIDSHKQAIKLKPDYAEAHNNLGAAYYAIDRLQEAIDAYKQAIKLKGDYAEAHNNLGAAYAAIGRGAEAIDAYNQAIKVKPDYAAARYNLANELKSRGRYDEAADQYRESLRLKGDWPDAMNDLAWLIATNPGIRGRDTNEAVRLASRACELSSYKNPVFLGTLAAAYASAGRFTEAIDTAKKAISLADAANQRQLSDIIRRQSSFYEQGKPYIER
jgi:tetratricopeptide (TPR) repeat protein